MLSCEICGREFLKINKLNRHRLSHSDSRPFVCPFPDCGKSYARNDHLNRHRASHATKQFACTVSGCISHFVTPDKLARHNATVHKRFINISTNFEAGPEYSGVDSPLRVSSSADHCIVPLLDNPTCFAGALEAAFSSVDTQSTHRTLNSISSAARAHNLAVAALVTVFPKSLAVSIHSDIGALKDPLQMNGVSHAHIQNSFSSTTFNSASKHTASSCFVCPHCPERTSFRKAHKLRHHLVKCHLAGPLFICTLPQCQAAFDTKIELTKHRHLIHDAKRYHCHHPDCTEKFLRFLEMKKHMEIDHPDLRPFACAECPRSFKTRNWLIEHVKTHRPPEYQCTEPGCTAAFTKSYNLQVHVRSVHLGLLPWLCDQCTDAFAHKHVLARHQRLIHSSATIGGSELVQLSRHTLDVGGTVKTVQLKNLKRLLVGGKPSSKRSRIAGLSSTSAFPVALPEALDIGIKLATDGLPEDSVNDDEESEAEGYYSVGDEVETSADEFNPDSRYDSGSGGANGYHGSAITCV